MNSLIENIVARLSEASFFKELCFTGQTFATPGGATKELADAFVWLDSDGIIIQVKERDKAAPSDQEAFEKWFSKKLIGKGSDQIADTLSFFKDHPALTVKNARGLQFELSELDAATMHKVIVFGSLAEGVDLHHQPKFHQSSRSGFIHLIQAVDFTNLLQITVSPGEMLAYLRFREDFLMQHKEARERTEKWLFGCFVHWSESDGAPELLSETAGEGIVNELKDDIAEVDMRLFMEFIGEWAAEQPDNLRVYPKLVVECAHLCRAEMRQFKKRILKCMSRLDKPAPLTLYRIVNTARDCVLVFGVMASGVVRQVEEGALSYTGLMQYIAKTSKAVGFFLTPFERDRTGTTPVYIERQWEYVEELEKLAAQFEPLLRPVNKQAGLAYKVSNVGEENGPGNQA